MAEDHPQQSVAELKSQVIVAAERGDMEAVLAVLQNCGGRIQDEILTRDVYKDSVLKTAVEHQQMNIVKLLVQEFQVNINATTPITCVRSDGALFYAIRKENVEMVKDLMKLGSNVNFVDVYLTPLIAACKDQSVDMVKLLINLGAHVNLQSRLGVSPLHAVCARDDWPVLPILECLLGKGADCNLQDDNGNTALHTAAMLGNNDVVEKLLQKQARILPNKLGFTPPFFVAEWRLNEGTMNVFLGSSALSMEEKISAIEFKAASLAPWDMNGVYVYLRQSLKARFGNPSQILQKSIREPIAAFGNMVESQTLDELETRKDDNFALLMECLAVQDRLLGGGRGKMCMTKNYFSIYRVLFQEERYEQAIALAEYGIGDQPCNAAINIFYTLLQLQSINVQSPGITLSSLVEWALQYCNKLLRKGPFAIATYSKLCLMLLNRCVQLDPTDAKQTVTSHAKFFLNSFPLRGTRFCSALHAATHIMIIRRDLFDLSLYKSAVEILVKCEAKIDEKDEMRQTILAYVLRDMTPGDDRREVVKFLIQQGANPAYLKNKNERLHDYIKYGDVVDLIRERYPLSLRHLAAHAIVDNSVQYEGHVPSIVAEFIRGHE